MYGILITQCKVLISQILLDDKHTLATYIFLYELSLDNIIPWTSISFKLIRRLVQNIVGKV